MICGALQTLNEEAFEDVVASERPSPTGGPSTGETIALTPIQESAEHDRSLAYLNDGTADQSLQLHTISLSNTSIDNSHNSNSNNNANSNNNNNYNNNDSHNASLSNSNKGNSSNSGSSSSHSHHNSMVVAIGSRLKHSNAIDNNHLDDDDNASEVIRMSGLNVHDSLPLKSPQIPKITTTLTLEHESKRNARSPSSSRSPSPSPPTFTSSSSAPNVSFMPDAKVPNNVKKVTIGDTHL